MYSVIFSLIHKFYPNFRIFLQDFYNFFLSLFSNKISDCRILTKIKDFIVKN